MAPMRLPSPIEESFTIKAPVKLNDTTKKVVDQLHDVVQNDTFDVKQSELQATKKTNIVDFEAFYGIKPTRIDRRFNVTLSDHSYLPKVSGIPTANTISSRLTTL
jgi:hypothetical protein